MSAWLRDFRLFAALAVLGALALGSCTTSPPTAELPAAAPPPVPEIPASIRPEEVVGRWATAPFTGRKTRRAPKPRRARSAGNRS